MKAKIRLLWTKLHAYLACFFLPLTLLYVASGVLYLFDIKGDVSATHEYPLTLSQPWPKSQTAAESLVVGMLEDAGHPPLPEDYFPEDGVHDWYGYKQEVILAPGEQPQTAKLIVKEHDFWHQLLLIHKGFAGMLFWLLAIFLGFSLVFSLVSGVIISLQMPQIKKQSMFALAAGTAVLLQFFLQGSW